jgi:DoxX-like protein
MKKTNLIYWVFTALLSALMLLASVPDVLRTDEAIAVFRHLGYPNYLLPFLGIAKIFGVVVILAPKLKRLKEWAYAGLVFDLLGALFSHISVGDPPTVWIFALIGLALAAGSYLLSRWSSQKLPLRLREAGETGY